MSGTNYLIDRATERNVLERKVLLEKFPTIAKRIAFRCSGPFGHPEHLYMCDNCGHHFGELDYPLICTECNCHFK